MVKRKVANIVGDAEASLRSRGYTRTRSKATTTTSAAACSTTSTKDPANTIEQQTLARQNPSPNPSHRAESSSIAEEDRLVNRILESAGIDPNEQNSRVETKAGWCLRQGLKHLVSVDNRAMAPLVEKHGAPSFYACLEQNKKQPCRHDDTNNKNKNEEATAQRNDPQGCFQSLCRIVAGQQLAGAAALAIWKRLLDTVGHDLTPQSVLDLVDVRYSSKEDVDAKATKKAKKGSSTSPPLPSLVLGDISRLQKPAGLSQSKATSIVHLAHAFQEGHLSESFLTKAKMNDDDDDDDTGLRDALLQIKGIGPWSCDMFLMFYLERPNVLPLGDLGVRKGIGKFFAMKPSTKTPSNGGMLCAKKDADRIRERVTPYHPYQSLLTYYMWKAADTKDFYHDNKKNAKAGTTSTEGEKPNSIKRGSNDSPN